MSLMGMRKALGDAIGQAGNREEIDAIVAVLNMVEENFTKGFSSLGSGNGAAQASRLGQLSKEAGLP